jgi:hypothetical protein
VVFFVNSFLLIASKQLGNCIPIIKKYRKRKPEPRERLVEAYEYFGDRINTFLLTNDIYPAEDILMEIFGVLKDDFMVVEILLDENDDSQEIFHSLNSQGKPLSQSDLLRSFVFMRAEKGEEDRDLLYEEYWKYFEDQFWDQQIRRGNQLASHLDTITRIFLSSKKGATVDSKKVHLEYKDWIMQEKPYSSVREELADFNRYGKRYLSLFSPPTGDDKFAEYAKRLKIWDIATIYPLIIYLFEEANLSSDELSRCFNDLESFIVRRLVCEKMTKEYNIYFLEMVSRCRRDGASHKRLRDILLQGGGETRGWPNDEEFIESWRNNSIYNDLSSSQVVAILRRIENTIRSSKSETITVHEASIEHIMPQKWSQHYRLDGALIEAEMSESWYLPLDSNKKEKWDTISDKVRLRNRLIHTIGNLTIVTQPLNTALSNGSFEAKTKELLHSSLMLNHYFYDKTVWDEQAINERANLLFKYASKIWPYPMP